MITLYTIGCPQCTILEKKLHLAGIEYETVSDNAILEAKGLTLFPVLEVDGTQYSYIDAVKWLKEKQNGN